MSIKDIFEPKCQHRHTKRDHPNCFNADGTPKAEIEHNPPKVLSLDIETLPLLTLTWGVWNQNIYPEQVLKDWCVLSYSAKWIGSDKIISDVLSTREAVMRDDKRLVGNFWKLLDEADVVITHNGKRFDLKKLNTRFWVNDFHKPHSYKVIDTLSTAKSVFGLTYNKLDYIAKFIGAKQKIETDMGLWVRCHSGEKQALEYMRQYNENDALMQEEIYLKMREWIPNHPNLAVYAKLENVCPVCLGKKFTHIGYYTANTQQYKEYRCSCGSVWHDTKSIKE